MPDTARQEKCATTYGLINRTNSCMHRTAGPQRAGFFVSGIRNLLINLLRVSEQGYCRAPQGKKSLRANAVERTAAGRFQGSTLFALDVKTNPGLEAISNLILRQLVWRSVKVIEIGVCFYAREGLVGRILPDRKRVPRFRQNRTIPTLPIDDPEWATKISRITE